MPSAIDLAQPIVRRGRRVVWIPVKRFDRRAIRTVEHALRIPAGHHCAVHVADDHAETMRLAIAWMEADPPAPLLVLDDKGSLASSVRSALESDIGGQTDEIVVVLSQPVQRRFWQRFAGDRALDRFERELAAIPHVLVVVVGVPDR